jgi:hypothetical protein
VSRTSKIKLAIVHRIISPKIPDLVYNPNKMPVIIAMAAARKKVLIVFKS